jgi:hypothetical protein
MPGVGHVEEPDVDEAVVELRFRITQGGDARCTPDVHAARHG